MPYECMNDMFYLCMVDSVVQLNFPWWEWTGADCMYCMGGEL